MFSSSAETSYMEELLVSFSKIIVKPVSKTYPVRSP